jgi:hypothetical protein
MAIVSKTFRFIKGFHRVNITSYTEGEIVMKGRGLNRRIPVTISFEIETLLKLDEILEKTKTNRSELVNFLVKTALSTFQPEKDAASIV